MNFENLKDRMNYYRSLADHKLIPGLPVLVMIDGKNFSKKIKKRFKLPFDSDFMEAMNQTAKYVCENIQGIKFAYTQSDEVSFILTDYDTETTDSAFGYRLCKLQSIIASTATAKFNQIMMAKLMKENYSKDDNAFTNEQSILNAPLYEFDCKAWNVPTENDVYAWFLHRQTDCIRNSKQQAAQTYLSHTQLMNKHTDDQVALLKETNNIDWEKDYSEGEKYGRFIYKAETQIREDLSRMKWNIKDAFPLYGDGKEKFINILNINKSK